MEITLLTLQNFSELCRETLTIKKIKVSWEKSDRRLVQWEIMLMLKCLKLLYLTTGMLCLLFSSPSFAQKWEEFFNEKVDGQRIVLEFDRQKQKIQLTRKKGFSKKRSDELDISDSESVDLALRNARIFLKDFALSPQLEADVLERIDELRYFSTKECKALHMDLENPLAQSKLGELLEHLDKVQSELEPGSKAFRSIFLFDLPHPDGRKIQIRAFTDKEGKFIKLTVATKEGDLTEHKMIFNDGFLKLYDPNGKVLFAVDPKGIKQKPSMIKTIVPSRSHSLSEIYFHKVFRDNKGKWSVLSAQNGDKTPFHLKDGVELTTNNLGHEAVVRVGQSEVHFPALAQATYNEIKMDLFGANSFDSFVKAENFYNHCMARVLSSNILKGNDLGEDSAHPLCLKSAILKLSPYYYQNLVESEGGTLSKDDINKEINQCFVKNKIFLEQDELVYLNDEKLGSLSQSGFKALFSTCHLKAMKMSLEELVKSKIQQNEEIAQILHQSPELKLSLERETLNQISHCAELNSETRFQECRNYLAFKQDESLFLAAISLKLKDIHYSDKRKFMSSRLGVVGAYSDCLRVEEGKVKKAISGGSQSDFSLLNQKNRECMEKAVHLISKELPANSVIDEMKKIDFFRGEEVNLTDIELEKIREDVSDCILDEIQEEESSFDLLRNFDSTHHSCLINEMKETLITKYLEVSKEEIEQFMADVSEEEKERIFQKIGRDLKRKLRKVNDLEAINAVLQSQKAYSYFAASSGHIDQFLGNYLGEDEEFDEKAKKEALSKAQQKFLGNTDLSFEAALKRKMESVYAENGDRGLLIFTNDFLKSLHLELNPWVSVKEIGKRVLVADERNAMTDEVHKSYGQCWDEFQANGKRKFSDFYKRCQKKRIGETVFQLAKRRLTSEVALHFKLTGEKANSILTPITYLQTCLTEIDPYSSKSIEEYEKLAKACVRMTEYDISYNLSRAKIEGYRPLLSKKGYHDTTTAYCYNIFFVQLAKDAKTRRLSSALDLKTTSSSRPISAAETSMRKTSPYGASILKLLHKDRNWDYPYRTNDSENVRTLLQVIAESPEIDEEWFGEKLAHCQKGTEDMVMTSFREHIIESMPSLSVGDGKNEKLMREFLDLELVELLLKFKKTKENQTLGVGSLVPSERLVTPELGMTALGNFIGLTGKYLSEGFIFDEKAMRTEMVVFQGELKDFLNWYLKHPTEVKVSEAQEFFNESTLADHLSMAIVSKEVRNQFHDYLRKAKQTEFGKFYKRIKCWSTRCMSTKEKQEYEGIKSKYENLLSTANQMTKAYDFRRIIRPESKKGSEVLAYIKKYYLTPKIMGQRPSHHVVTQVRKKIGELILADNTAGGFAERFVHEVAQQHLDNQSRSKWGITKWLFYDSGDFDWTKLRKTKAGRKAIDYYARHLMLPKILGRQQSQYLINLRMSTFRKLLGDAQGQNDD